MTEARRYHGGMESFSAHHCLIYDGPPARQLPVVAPLLAAGLGEGRRALYFGPEQEAALVRAALVERGLDVERETRRGGLVFDTHRQAFDGPWTEARELLGALERTVGDALAHGFHGVVATGDMRWELGSDANVARAAEYERALEELMARLPLAGVCRYRRDTLPATAIRDALLTHRLVFVGEELRESPYYGGSGGDGEAMWRALRG